MKSLSFDGLSTHYDETRTFDPRCFASAIDWIRDTFPAARYPCILEPGVGTGRIAKPLAECGYNVYGIDISMEMLNICLTLRQTSGSIHCLMADATHLPFLSETFDLAIAVHLFYFISDWRTAFDEMIRVLRPTGRLLFLHTGYGVEIPQINEMYKTCAVEYGYDFPVYGVRSTQEVVRYAESKNYKIEQVESPHWSWDSRIKVNDALEHIVRRSYSFLKDVPDELHAMIVNRLRAILGPSLSSYEEVQNRISLVVITPQPKLKGQH